MKGGTLQWWIMLLLEAKGHETKTLAPVVGPYEVLVREAPLNNIGYCHYSWLPTSTR